MNRKQRRTAKSQNKHTITIQFRGRAYTIQEADALVLKERNLGNLQAVVDIYDRILLKFPEYSEAWNNRGNILLEMKQHDDALASYDKAIAVKPDSAESYNNRGNVLQEMRQYDLALANYDMAIALKPDYFEAYNNRGNVLLEMKRYDAALENYDLAITLRPDCAESYNNRGAVLQQVKRYEAALDNYTKAVALKPDYPEAYHNIGVILANKGNMPEAEKMFVKALALNSSLFNPLFSLVNIRKYKDAEHEDIKLIKTLLGYPNLLPRDKDHLYFSLGKIYDDCGLYDAAFENYRLANETRNASVSYNKDVITALSDNIITAISRDFLAQSSAFASGSRSPVFIVGMPRSGTTLMASILSNHPAIASAGELPTMTEFALRLPALAENIPYPQAMHHLAPEIASGLIQDYEKRLRRDTPSDVPFVIDKHPLNFRHLGFISRLFPKATIIHCTRSPMDTCLSNYFQRFPLDYEYSFDLQNIGHFYGEYVRIMKHWRKVLSMKIVETRYEEMVMNTEQMARKVLDAIGLEWDERCLTPHTNKYAVETASYWQVRQPIYDGSMERWRHYEKHLGPLKEMLPG